MQPSSLTLHDVVMPTVSKLPVIPILVQATQKDLIRVTVFEMDEFPQACQEVSVAVGAILIGQDGHLIIHLQRQRHGVEERETCQMHCSSERSRLSSTGLFSVTSD